MKRYMYLIIGGGMTADAAVRGIREIDPTGSIGLIGNEADPPYNRPPLSKGMWKGRPFEKIWCGTGKLGVDLHLGRAATGLDPASRLVRDDRREEYTYSKLLLATGGSPNRLPFGNDHIIYYRTLRDYERLRALAEARQRFLVIGGGFIGTEIAAALKMQGKDVTMVFPGHSIGESAYPPELSLHLNDFYRQKEIDVVPGDSVAAVDEKGNCLLVSTQGGREYEVDGVVAGIGIRPNLDVARLASIRIHNGIVVDDHQRTSAAEVYAAGDVALYPDAVLGRHIRVEHEDNALMMGKQAGRNMAGAGEPYIHTPYFYSDLFEFGYEAVGELSSQLQTISDWQEPFQRGVVYYLAKGRLRGVLLWNVWKKVEQATALMAEPGPFGPADLKGRISA